MKMNVTNVVDSELIDWDAVGEVLVSGRLTGSIPFSDIGTPEEFARHVETIEQRRRLRSELRDEIARQNSKVPHLSVIDQSVMDEVELELDQEMGPDPIDAFRRDLLSHVTSTICPRIAGLREEFGVIPAVAQTTETFRISLSRLFPTQADRELFEAGAEASFRWMVNLNIDFTVHGTKTDCYSALIAVSNSLCMLGYVADLRAVYAPSDLPVDVWEDATGRSLDSSGASRNKKPRWVR